MEKGQIIYFYYNTIIPCQKGRIKEIIPGGYEVSWLNSNDKSTGVSSIPAGRIFATENECIEYNKKLVNELKDNLKGILVNEESILLYMYSCIYSEDYDCEPIKEVLREKIKEVFGIEIE